MSKIPESLLVELTKFCYVEELETENQQLQDQIDKLTKMLDKRGIGLNLLERTVEHLTIDIVYFEDENRKLEEQNENLRCRNNDLATEIWQLRNLKGPDQLI